MTEQDKSTENKKWYRRIPGFRSGKKWKMITASIVYLILFFSIFPADEEDTTEEQVQEGVAVAEEESAEEAETEEEAPEEEEQKKAEQTKAEEEAEDQRKTEEEAENNVITIAEDKGYVYNVELIEEDYTFGTDEDIQVFSPEGEEHYRIEMEHDSSFFGSDNLNRIQELTEEINEENADYDYLVFEIVRSDGDEDERWVYTRFNNEQSEQIVNAEDINDKVFENNTDFFAGNGGDANIGFGEEAVNYDDMTAEEMIEYAIESNFGDNAIESNVSETESGLQVETVVALGSSWSEGTAVTRMDNSIASFIGDLHNFDLNYNSVSVTYNALMVDEAGNEDDSDILISEFDDATIKEINPDNQYVYEQNLDSLATTWWLHPAFR